MNRILIFLASLTLTANAVSAEIYKCRDGAGKMTFSDVPCAAGSRQAQTGHPATTGAQPRDAGNPAKPVYTKDIPSIKAPDEATQACFDHVNTTQNFPDPSTTRILSTSRKWVSVRNVGARQMVQVEITSKNENGMYVGTRRESCLMMGDGKTVNTKPYELL